MDSNVSNTISTITATNEDLRSELHAIRLDLHNSIREEHDLHSAAPGLSAGWRKALRHDLGQLATAVLTGYLLLSPVVSAAFFLDAATRTVASVEEVR